MQSLDVYLIRWLVQAIGWLRKVVVIIQYGCTKAMKFLFAFRSNYPIRYYTVSAELAEEIEKNWTLMENNSFTVLHKSAHKKIALSFWFFQFVLN